MAQTGFDSNRELVLQGALERAAADELAVRADLFRQLSLYYRRTWHNPAEFTTQ